MALSQTEIGKDWLNNFRDSERQTATLLVDKLRFVSTSKIRSDLEAEILSSDRYVRPAAFYPIRALDDFPGVGDAWDKPSPVFVDFDPTKSLLASPGSEALTANLLRNFAKHREDVLGPDSGLSTLREKKCRSIVFVEDYAGSGDQCIEYVRSWLANRTLRSWRSFGWIKFHVLLHSVSVMARSRIELLRYFGLESLTVIDHAPALDNVGWTPDQVRNVKRLCRSYAADRDLALGYMGSGGLLVMQHTAPDNLPIILWQDKGRTADGKRWRPLLPKRTIPAELLAYSTAGYAPTRDFSAAAGFLKAGSVTEALERPISENVRQILFVLGACVSGIRQADRLAAASGVSMRAIEETLGTLRRWELIDELQRPTDRGRAEFARQARRARHANVDLIGSDAPYYPKALRGVAGI